MWIRGARVGESNRSKAQVKVSWRAPRPHSTIRISTDCKNPFKRPFFMSPPRARKHPAFLAGCFLLLALGGGCAPTPAPPVVAPQSQVSAARSRSLERALSGVSAETVRAWVNRYSAPPNAAPAPKAPPLIYINVEVLARRHAAWQLADELLNGGLAPTAARQVAVSLPQNSREARAQSTSTRTRLDAIDRPNALPTRPSRVVTASESNGAALAKSRATLDDFLADLRARQTLLEGAQTDLERQALEDRIRAATRGAVEAIELTPVSPETALELSNLRLQLLAQLRVPPAKQAAATQEIERIEARLNAIWSAQTQAQNAKLRAALEELPARLRREGLAALNEAAARRAGERIATNLELRRTIEARLRGAAPASNAQILRLLLPPARVASFDLPGGALGAPDSFFQTPARPNSSKRGSDGMEIRVPGRRDLAVPAATREATIARLRAQARSDAQQWARNLALNWNTQLGTASAPNRTNQAVTALFG